MAHFSGFKCDSCGSVGDTADRTVRTVKIKGPVTQGEFSVDLCSDCVEVPEDVEMKPLRRRTGTQATSKADTGPEVQEDPTDAPDVTPADVSGLIQPVS